MLKIYNPRDAAPPLGQYSNGVEVSAGSRILAIAGQVGADADGTMLDGFAAQVDRAWTNFMLVLRAAGMDAEDLVQVNSYIVVGHDYEVFKQVRARHLKDARPASTVLYLPRLARPEWLFEIDGIAARAT